MSGDDETGGAVARVATPRGRAQDAAAREESKARAERDRVLVERAKQGDRAAFRELYDCYHRRAFVLAEGVVKNREDALDVVQEAFVKVHRHLDGFEGGSSFYTWLYRIVMNLAIDHGRKSKRRRTTEFDEAREPTEIEDAPLGRFAGGHPSRTVLRRELSEKIVAALDELPEYHRAVIVLREVDGLSYEELAEVMGVPKGTIMSRLFHARRKMQESLAPYLDGELELEDE